MNSSLRCISLKIRLIWASPKQRRTSRQNERPTTTKHHAHVIIQRYLKQFVAERAQICDIVSQQVMKLLFCRNYGNVRKLVVGCCSVRSNREFVVGGLVLWR